VNRLWEEFIFLYPFGSEKAPHYTTDVNDTCCKALLSHSQNLTLVSDISIELCGSRSLSLLSFENIVITELSEPGWRCKMPMTDSL